ncbi:unnamed protein product, partial [Discosporangium mesarthrocarpum]
CLSAAPCLLGRYIVKNNLLVPVFAVFRENCGRDNLINSAIIELVEFIRAENSKSLVEYIVDKFSDTLNSAKNVPTFQSIILKHEQNLDLDANWNKDLGEG